MSLRVRSEKGRSGLCLTLSRVLFPHPSHQEDTPCHISVVIGMNAEATQFYPFPIETFFCFKFLQRHVLLGDHVQRSLALLALQLFFARP